MILWFLVVLLIIVVLADDYFSELFAYLFEVEVTSVLLALLLDSLYLLLDGIHSIDFQLHGIGGSAEEGGCCCLDVYIC